MFLGNINKGRVNGKQIKVNISGQLRSNFDISHL